MKESSRFIVPSALFSGFLPLFKQSIVLACASALLLTACGGGGGGNGNVGSFITGDKSDAWRAGVYQSSDTYKNFCAAPRVGASRITGMSFPDRKGTALQEKNFLRSWSHETYLWFEDLPDLNPSSALTPQEYFLRLVSDKKTASGAYKDNFHWYEPTEAAEAWSAGISYGYGLNLKINRNDTLSIHVAYVEQGSPAANKNIKRGTKIVAIDGQNVTSMPTNKINEALRPPRVNAVHEFELQEPGITGTRKVILESAALPTESVSIAKAINHNGSQVAYLQYNTFIPDSQDKWVDAVNSLNAAGVSDLVLDLRYNGGGYITVAAQVGYMIAGSNTTNKVFFQEVTNSKLPKEDPWGFIDTGLYGLNKFFPLPSLNLKRVYVLSTDSTCSASELVINSLRGIGVSVYLIGDSTCGKPYGYVPTPNCGTTYYTIQLKSVNALGFGEYSDGFIPSSSDNGLDRIKGCKVVDNLKHELGDPNEALLAAALHLRATGSCPTTVNGRQQKITTEQSTGELFIPETRTLLIHDR